MNYSRPRGKAIKRSKAKRVGTVRRTKTQLKKFSRRCKRRVHFDVGHIPQKFTYIFIFSKRKILRPKKRSPSPIYLNEQYRYQRTIAQLYRWNLQPIVFSLAFVCASIDMFSIYSFLVLINFYKGEVEVCTILLKFFITKKCSKKFFNWGQLTLLLLCVLLIWHCCASQ